MLPVPSPWLQLDPLDARFLLALSVFLAVIVLPLAVWSRFDSRKQVAEQVSKRDPLGAWWED